MTTPEWLTRRGGELRPGPLGNVWYVFLGGEPQYALTPTPVEGQHGCRVTQTINGRLLASTGPNATETEAIQASLEDLRKALGW